MGHFSRRTRLQRLTAFGVDGGLSVSFGKSAALGGGRVKGRSPPAIGQFTVVAQGSRIAKTSDEVF
jgi:hypothetical protein